MTYRLLLVAYVGLAGVLPAGGRPWLAVPLCLAATLATGALWTRALSGIAAEAPIPAVRGGLAAVAGLITWPLIALILHAAGQPVRPIPLVIGCAVLVTLLGAAAILRDRRRSARRAAAKAGLPTQRRHDPGPLPAESSPDHDIDFPPPRRYVRTTAAVTIPVVLAVSVGGVTVRGYLNASRPAEPGYLSIALNGWAAAIDTPVTVPARGLVVPVRVSSAGLGTTTLPLRLRVGGRVVASRPMTVNADSVRSLTVYVPALPADGCLHPVDISVGDTSTGFYARGHAGSDPVGRTTAGAALTGPGVRPRAARAPEGRDPGVGRAPAKRRVAAAAERAAC
ncbi:hypothetical protein Ait01nite_094410 [Actinoplanes italicus]|uniref:Uncharacterized protein n=1 Tax=Actinoplanes italicus TaxID=113567 RepID=A0A2T0KD91_9ACTN|nr:hypothetical protein [Actinoplanes italicus]PRX21266.1 hypothetical protein CLV67_10640 [Actinoplanes italicus]GIE36396.1 hypothetical protein Ait01nite_094410 [Actinoplanes italicus]